MWYSVTGSTVTNWTNTGTLGGKFIIKTGPGGTVATVTAAGSPVCFGGLQ